jgi:hypothetical protein
LIPASQRAAWCGQPRKSLRREAERGIMVRVRIRGFDDRIGRRTSG